MKRATRFLILAAVVVAVLRLNLPPAQVSAALDLGALESADPVTRAIGGAAREISFSDQVADWHYRDFIVFRTARSQRFGWNARALPFGKWKIVER